MNFDTSKIRNDFPALSLTPNGHPLVYLDSAATALKPRAVIAAMDHFHRFETANVHRGAHYLSDKATEKYEGVRETVKKFIHAQSANEIIFTRGTTDAVNLVAHSFGKKFVNESDEIVITEMEHHSNLVPWQQMALERGARLRVIKVNDQGELDMDHYRTLLNSKTKMVALTHCSNAIGTINPVKEIVADAHQVGAKVFVDAAQSVGIMPLNVQDMNCDFLAFSAHKLYGPYGAGVLFGKESILNSMPPYQTGGSMINRVSITEGTTFLSAPQRYEAGTPNIAGVIGMETAINYFKQWDTQAISEHKKEILQICERALSDIPGVEIVGRSATKTNIISFNMAGSHPSDIGHLLDQQGIAVRAGHHCAQPLMERFGLSGTLRVSFGIYNDKSDVESFIKALRKAREMLI